MKQNLLLLVSILLLSFYAGATDITVGSAIGEEISGTWTKNSKITVNGHVIIPEGKSLTIEDGVQVMFNDSSLHIEFIVFGNLYCKGTKENPIYFTASDKLKVTAESSSFPRIWSGIICAESCQEVLLLNTSIAYTGAVTTNSSPSVALQLYKAAAGEGIPALNFRNPTSGKLVIKNCTFHNLGEDGVYLEGGQYIIENNKFYTQGETGGDAINLKAGSIADISYNLVFSPNTNALKLSNSGDRSPQCNPICYNNTIINCGWRRPTVKGGGIWLQGHVLAEIYNNLHVNCRFAVKNSKANAGSKYDYNYYYGNDQETVDNFQQGVKDVVRGDHDVAGTTAGSNDPLFENFDLAYNKSSEVFNTTWNFHLKANSPAIGAGITNFTRHFATTGITILGVEYKSAEPSTTIGAFGLQAAESVSVSKKEIVLVEGQSETLSAEVMPSNAADKTITWKSDNTAVATVDNGMIVAVSAGTAHIIVTTNQGNYSDTCTVTVNKKVSINSFNEKMYKIYPNPVSDFLNIKIDNNSKSVLATVYSVSGTEILKYRLELGENQIPVSFLGKGTYLVEVKNDEQTYRQLIIKK